jgi:putative transposase
VLAFVQPETVIAWQRKRFRDYWTRMGRAGKPGRPLLSEEIRELIRKVSGANPLWGTPRIVGELGKLGIKVAKSTVDKYRVRSGKTPSPTWKAFLKNQVNDLVSIDFFIVPTIRFKLLFVVVVLAHSRRKVLHFNVTENPTAQWFPLKSAVPRGNGAQSNVIFWLRFLCRHLLFVPSRLHGAGELGHDTNSPPTRSKRSSVG